MGVEENSTGYHIVSKNVNFIIPKPFFVGYSVVNKFKFTIQVPRLQTDRNHKYFKEFCQILWKLGWRGN